MALFFTSDFHLGDSTAVRLMARPFKTFERMTDVLVANANSRAPSKGDTIVHVGDFCSYGNDHGLEGARIHGKDYLKMFSANMVLLEGNHDRNNEAKPVGKMMFVDLSRHYKNISVSHFPSWNDILVPTYPGHIHICGHVHSAWKYKIYQGVLNINVGVDVWNYQIVSVQELLKLIAKVTRTEAFTFRKIG